MKTYNQHEENIKSGYRILEVIEPEPYLNGTLTKMLEMNVKKGLGEIVDYLITPTELVPESVKNTDYEKRTDLGGLLTVYVRENKIKN